MSIPDDTDSHLKALKRPVNEDAPLTADMHPTLPGVERDTHLTTGETSVARERTNRTIGARPH